MERKQGTRFESEMLSSAWGWLEQKFAATPRPEARLPPTQALPTQAGGDPPRILVAEDMPSLQYLTCRTLASIGADPLLAVNGAQAVALAEAVQFDLILMDLQMPVLDGFGAARRIRQHEREHGRPRVPLVAYTACPYEPNEPFMLDFGIDAVLHKPCTRQVLTECLLKWIAPRRGVELFVPVGHGAPASVTRS